MWSRLLTNHVLANLTFVLVLAIGIIAYQMLPRQQDPTINFNWISIVTALPGASASDVERRVTDPLEQAVQGISDIRFVSSNSREGISSLLIRFNDIDERTFDKHLSAIRREIQNAEDELPEQASDPFILEITSANAFPSVMVAVTGPARDENLRRQAVNIENDLERIKGVDRVDAIALDDPEIHINLDLPQLERLGINPAQVSDAVAQWFKDISAGSVNVGDQSWLVRLVGRSEQPDTIKALPLTTQVGEIRLERIADVVRAREQAAQLATVNGQPAVLMAVMKKDSANTLSLVERVETYVTGRNALTAETGVQLSLVDDQTVPTREAINLMQNNAAIGLLLVLLVAWLFLGFRIALLTAIGIPFILAGTFWVLWMMGETLNVVVLLGVVIVLGMLVDDAVVVVEAIYYRLQHGEAPLAAAVNALHEVAQPVLSAVLTTMAAFLPLMLLPGILGDFMRVIPMVVTLALAISLLEAFWMLPAHVVVAKVNVTQPKRSQQLRERMTAKIQRTYLRLLLRSLRRPVLTLMGIGVLVISTGGLIASGQIKMDFFASDPLRLFYVNVEMPPDYPLEKTQAKVIEVEAIVKRHLAPDEARAVATYAGQMFTETEPFFGNQYGQILVGLNPKTPENRDVDAVMDSMRDAVQQVAGPLRISFLRMAGGPPVSKPISVKVRGDNYAEIRRAANDLQAILATQPDIRDIGDDAGAGRMTLTVKPDYSAITTAGLQPSDVMRTVQLLVDGEVVADMQSQGKKLEIRVRANARDYANIDDLLKFRIPDNQGALIPLSALVDANYAKSLGNIRHYNFRRAITVEADLVEGGMDTVQANAWLVAQWEEKLQASYPNINLDFSGELDDIQESMDSIAVLFLFGLGLMYLILGTQFSSYWQPFMIIATVPMAFTGVVLGLWLTGNPLSLYTLYGVVALAGIAVNAAIVLISAANQRLAAGMSVLHATLYAARRRVIPILITSLTTIAGLFSLATGLGGKSLIWGPVATSIVCGLAFSTLLTLFVVPLLYRLFMSRKHKKSVPMV
ncbi:efflux RND transporter permease subunit [Neptunomonas marina]|uniref:Efflux RND transporter permease subunit n=1 Tax=Neptunomonas marina TaxID=1815562 RepID=A0A437QAS2_9GAMM|nr:efflux RND transporter permease subunit [Neptunomonas marina]RVU31644.1 efflux RND transporter permease subunit [Neptunomonas marina]